MSILHYCATCAKDIAKPKPVNRCEACGGLESLDLYRLNEDGLCIECEKLADEDHGEDDFCEECGTSDTTEERHDGAWLCAKCDAHADRVCDVCDELPRVERTHMAVRHADDDRESFGTSEPSSAPDSGREGA